MAARNYKSKAVCRCCGHDDLKSYLDLGLQPLANNLLGKRNEKFLVFPLETNVCPRCFHSQLSITVNPDLMFNDYLFMSGIAESHIRHFENIAAATTSLVEDAARRMNVLDIAANNGALLEVFKKAGCNVIGIDPAQNLIEHSLKRGVEVMCDYWSKESAAKLPWKPNIITATNVFAHVDDPLRFLKLCEPVLAENGIILLEFPYGMAQLLNMEYDAAYFEHLSSFTVRSLKALVDQTKLKITAISTVPSYGTSLRVILSRGKESPELRRLIKAEGDYGIHDMSFYMNYQRRIEAEKAKVLWLVQSVRKMPLVGYGASAKACTMLNFLDLDLEFIVDENKLKVGRFLPGLRTPIVAVSELKKVKNPFIFVTPWNFYDEIKTKIGKTVKSGLVFRPVAPYKLEMIE